MQYRFFVFVSIFWWFWSACDTTEHNSYDAATQKKYAEQYCQEQLRDLAQNDTLLAFVKGKNSERVRQTFQKYYEPTALLWQDAATHSALAAVEQYLVVLSKASEHGLVPEHYAYTLLNESYATMYPPNSPEMLERLQKMPQFDAQLTASALLFANDMWYGKIAPSGHWEMDTRRRNVAGDLQKAIQSNKIAEFFDSLQPKYPQYARLKAQLQKPEVSNNATTANLVRLNMDRYRMMPDMDSLGSRYVWVNLPEFMLQFVEGKDTTASIVVVVGDVKSSTPVVTNRKMQNVVFSPVWNVPTGIAYEEIEYILRNPAVLIVADVDVFVDGKKVDPRDVDWNNTARSRIKMRQRPKTTNSMGLVKFPFDNDYGVYLHDTPNKGSFGNRNRAESHGCVRVGNPLLLSQQILKGSNWTSDGMQRAMYSGKQQFASIPRPVRVNLVYFTASVDSKGNLVTRRDVYGYDSRQIKQL